MNSSCFLGLAAREGVDLLHSLASTAPVRGRFRRVVTIHDLIYRIHPEAHFGFRRLGMRVLVPLAARRSTRIIAPSQCTKADLTEVLKVPSEKVDVVPQGVTPPSERAEREGDIRVRYGLGSRSMILTVSAKRPHKNLPRLLDALALIPAQRRPLLVLPGYPTPHEGELRRRANELGLGGDVRFLGWTSAGELEDLYRAAAVFVYPSLYEGFGLPILEAMVRGVPVACSDRASLTEVAGAAARYFNPERPEMIAEAIENLLSDPAEAERLRRAGLERASRSPGAHRRGDPPDLSPHVRDALGLDCHRPV